MTIENDKAIEVINQIRKNLKAFFILVVIPINPTIL